MVLTFGGGGRGAETGTVRETMIRCQECCFLNWEPRGRGKYSVLLLFFKHTQTYKQIHVYCTLLFWVCYTFKNTIFQVKVFLKFPNRKFEKP